MKIKINREIDVPDSLTCTGKKSCSALNKDGYDWPTNKTAKCQNFNSIVVMAENGPYFTKCRPCIDATLDWLNGVMR